MSFVKTILGATAATVLATLQVQAATITGKLTADNYFQVSYGTGGNHTVVYQDNDGNQWNQLNTVSFDIPDDVLADCGCRIAITVWGDGAVAEGLYGFLGWNANTVHTGNSAYTVANAGQTGPLSGPQIANLAGSGGTASANNYNWPGLPNGQSQWIWDGTGQGGGGDNKARVFSVKCSDVVSSGGGTTPTYSTTRPVYQQVQPVQIYRPQPQQLGIEQRRPPRVLQPTWK